MFLFKTFSGRLFHERGSHRFRRENGLGLLGRQSLREGSESQVLRPQLCMEQANQEIDKVNTKFIRIIKLKN